jgi:hypothetical protein
MSSWKTVKSAGDMKLDGVAVDAEFRDKTLSAVTLTDTKGQAVRFVLENYAVKAMVPAPAEKKAVHVVTGAVPVLGTPVREECEDKFSADMRKHELESAGVIENAAIAVEEIEIPF